jgi:hypothetical protein
MCFAFLNGFLFGLRAFATGSNFFSFLVASRLLGRFPSTKGMLAWRLGILFGIITCHAAVLFARIFNGGVAVVDRCVARAGKYGKNQK